MGRSGRRRRPVARSGMATSTPTSNGCEDGEASQAPAVARAPTCGRHLRAGRAASSASGEIDGSSARCAGRPESLARQFDKVLQRARRAWAYLDGWSLTPRGERLARIYHESDLLVAECLRAGLLDDLDPPAVAALASTFTYETRGPGPAPPASFPSGKLRKRWGDLERIARELNLAEDDTGLPLTRAPDPGFVGLAHSWAAGDGARRRPRRRRAVGRRLRAQREAAHRPAPPARRRRRPTRPRRPSAARAADSALPRRGRGIVEGRRAPGAAPRPVTITKGRRRGAGPLPDDGVVVRTPTPRPGPRRGGRRQGRAPASTARPARRRPVPHARRARATRRACGRPSRPVPGRPRRGADRRAAALVRRPPGRPRPVAGRRAVRGHDAHGSARGCSGPGRIPATASSTSIEARCRWPTASRCEAGSDRLAPAPPGDQDAAGSGAFGSTSAGPIPCGSTVRVLGRDAREHLCPGSSPMRSPSSCEVRNSPRMCGRRIAVKDRDSPRTSTGEGSRWTSA